MNSIEVEECDGGSPAVRGAANRLAFEATIERACTCVLELPAEPNGIRCAKCDARLYQRRA